MEKENIFSRLNSKDYNNQLEIILEDKKFSENIKNLLLSMLYKIEAGYKDYIKVKQIVEPKKIYIEEILSIIKNKCNEIIIVQKDSEDSLEMEKMGTNFLVDKLEGTIKLMYPNEKLLLYTLYKLDDKQVYLDEKYNLIRNALSELLNAGENMNNIEVLRDFNGWNWNIEVTEIPEITTNLIYQNLIFLLGIEKIKKWIHSNEIRDFIPIIEEELKTEYGYENTKEILEAIYKISILVCTSKNERERERLLDEQELIKGELEKLGDKKKLLDEISEMKKESLNSIKKIDTILSDKRLLEEEYIKRNEKRSEYNKIFSLNHLTDILNKERKRLLALIEEKNKLLEPKYYVEKKQDLENQLDLLENINLEENIKKEKIYEYQIKLQKAFMNCFITKISQATDKDQVLNLIYLLRYYEYIFMTENKQIRKIEELSEVLVNLEKELIKKAYELKIIFRVSKNEEINYKIIRNIFQTKIISINNIGLELKQEGNMFDMNLYDSDVFEKTIKLEMNKEDILIKTNKVVKIINI